MANFGICQNSVELKIEFLSHTSHISIVNSYMWIVATILDRSFPSWQKVLLDITVLYHM